MANTYTLIASNTLSSSAASVTFSSIPNTYTDLMLRISARANSGTIWSGSIDLEFNGSSASTTLYSNTEIIGNGASVSNNRNSNGARWYGMGGGMDTAGNTSNTFSSYETYIANYTASQNKAGSVFTASEQNGTTAYITASANLFRSTNAITSIFIANGYGTDFAAGSSFFLYGIKNS